MSNKERLNFNYKTSKDYEKLFQLVQKQRVICIVTYVEKIGKYSEIILRDICASGTLSTKENIRIGSRDIGFVEAFSYEHKTIKEDFFEQCKHYKLEFIDPDMVQDLVQ
jgi:tetrahydromethanopterin S-methyltransferase subunit F